MNRRNLFKTAAKALAGVLLGSKALNVVEVSEDDKYVIDYVYDCPEWDDLSYVVNSPIQANNCCVNLLEELKKIEHIKFDTGSWQ